MPATRVGRSWHTVYPDRWRRELNALRTAGLRYRISYPRSRVRLLVDYPVGDRVGRLRVDFGLYPWFPPTVTDPDDQLGVIRHRNPVSGQLCMTHEDIGWDTDTTVAELLTRQVPKILATGTTGTTDTDEAARTMEMPMPEGANIWRIAPGPAVIVPTAPVPGGCDSGALVARTSLARGASTFVIEEIHGDGWTLTQDRVARLDRLLRVAVFGRWLRMPDFDPALTTRQLWRVVEPRLAPLTVEGQDALSAAPDVVQLIGLRVPGEPAYRTRGEEWVFLLAFKPAQSRPGQGLRIVRCSTQQTPDDNIRIPRTDALAGSHVVVVGTGATGHHVAIGLARAGVGILDVVDRDVVDVGTARRQFVPLWACGTSKAHTLADDLHATAPTSRITGYHLDVGDLAEDNAETARVRRSLARAHLVIDATANPSVTRYLGAVRHAAGRPFLHVSATAGAWGGVVALTRPDDGCWACVEHHRHGGTLPVPRADPDGWVTPVGCGSPTFTGDNASLGSVAMHALRVATGFLTEEPGLSDAGVWVASLRTSTGQPQAIVWEHERLRAHEACPLHDPALRAPVGVA